MSGNEKNTTLLDKSAGGLARTPAKPLARVLLELIRFRKRDQPVRLRETPIRDPNVPFGPFISRYPARAGDLLIFVPRSIESHLIDHLTGGYGYSHVAVDTGEIDLVTRKRVMIESTVNHPVGRAFQDKYGPRPFVRISLRQAGAYMGEFANCVLSKLGEPYDTLEALTWGQVDDPARQICSDLAVDCLPPLARKDFTGAYRAGKLRRRSLSLHPRRNGALGVFASPNGFAEYFGAPPGTQVHRPDQLLSPREQRKSLWVRTHRSQAKALPVWEVGFAVLAGILIAYAMSKLVPKVPN